ncbi:hypothetical protein D3C81_1947750 [compost metagenome]
MEAQPVVAFKCGLDFLDELPACVQPGDFELILDCQHLEVITRYGFAQRARFTEQRSLGGNERTNTGFVVG